jgi:site-specific DNA recombinase
LAENRKHARQSIRGAKYLLQGLVVCKCCGYSYCGKSVNRKSAQGKCYSYNYYRCNGTDVFRFGGQRICSNTQVRTDQLEAAVWGEILSLLENPQRLEAEYQRRQTEPSSAQQQNLTALETQIAKARRGLGRLIDSYAEGLIDKTEFEPRITRLKERITALETQAKQVIDEVAQTTEIRLIIGRLEEFSTRVKDGLTKMDWSTQREIIRTLVKRVEVEKEKVNIVFRIASNLSIADSGQDCLQHCRGRAGSCRDQTWH